MCLHNSKLVLSKQARLQLWKQQQLIPIQCRRNRHNRAARSISPRWNAAVIKASQVPAATRPNGAVRTLTSICFISLSFSETCWCNRRRWQSHDLFRNDCSHATEHRSSAASGRRRDYSRGTEEEEEQGEEVVCKVDKCSEQPNQPRWCRRVRTLPPSLCGELRA